MYVTYYIPHESTTRTLSNMCPTCSAALSNISMDAPQPSTSTLEYISYNIEYVNYVQNNLGQVPARIIKSLTPLLLDTLDTRSHDTTLHHVTSHDSTHAEDAVQVRRLHEEGVLLFLATLEKLLRVLLVQHCAGVVHLKTAKNTNR